MKKTRFLLAAMLLVTMFTFTGCGNQDDRNNDAIPDDQQNTTIEQDVDDAGDDIKDDMDDAADDVKDAVDGEDDRDDKKQDDKNQTTKDDKDQTGENMGQ